MNGVENFVGKTLVADRPGERQGPDQCRHGGDRLAPARRFRAPRNGLGKNVDEGLQAVGECPRTALPPRAASELSEAKAQPRAGSSRCVGVR